MQTSLKRNMIVLALSRCQFAANYPLMSPLQNGIPGNVYEFADRIIPLPSCPRPSVMPASFRHARPLLSFPRRRESRLGFQGRATGAGSDRAAVGNHRLSPSLLRPGFVRGAFPKRKCGWGEQSKARDLAPNQRPDTRMTEKGNFTKVSSSEAHGSSGAVGLCMV